MQRRLTGCSYFWKSVQLILEIGVSAGRAG